MKKGQKVYVVSYNKFARMYYIEILTIMEPVKWDKFTKIPTKYQMNDGYNYSIEYIARNKEELKRIIQAYVPELEK